MFNRIIAKSLLIAFTVATLVSCKKDDELATNVVQGGTGVTSKMNWISNSTTIPAGNMDLDIYLYSGTGSSKTMTSYGGDLSTGSEETFEMPNSLADGEYTITVVYFDVPAVNSTTPSSGAINLDFSPANSSSATGKGHYTISGINFTSNDDQTEKELVKFVKKGNEFTFTKL